MSKPEEQKMVSLSINLETMTDFEIGRKFRQALEKEHGLTIIEVEELDKLKSQSIPRSKVVRAEMLIKSKAERYSDYEDSPDYLRAGMGEAYSDCLNIIQALLNTTKEGE